MLRKSGRFIESLGQFSVDLQRGRLNPLKMPRKPIRPPPTLVARQARFPWSSTPSPSPPDRPGHRSADHPARTTDKKPAGVQGDDHHPLAFSPDRPSPSACAVKRSCPSALFSANPVDCPKMPDSSRHRALSAHNECLWMTVCVPMTGRFMRRYATHRAPACAAMRRITRADAPLYAPFVIIFAAMRAISVPYGA